MNSCFATCGCDDLEGITKSDLDRFTDKIENVLGDEKGRRLFGGFMFTAKLRDGKKCLNFWEHCEQLLNYRNLQTNDQTVFRRFLNEVDDLIEEAERVEELDFAIMERLTITRDREDKDEILNVLKLLKTETAKAMWREFNQFRKHYSTRM